jgi:hypothetical protein
MRAVMRWCARLFLFAFLLPTASLAAAALSPVKIDRSAFAEDERVATTLHAIFDAKRFDEVAARRLMPVLLVDGLSPEEQDLYYELIQARFPIQIRSPYGPAFMLPPPDGAARDYMSLLKLVVESNNLQMTLDARWLAGGMQMKELVDISTFGQQLENAITTFVERKLAVNVTMGNALSGFTMLKDDLAKVRAQLAMTDIDTEKRGKGLIYAAMKNIDDKSGGAVPDDLYADFKQ